MVVDDLHTNFGRTQRVKAAARQFVERRLGANDLMAVIHTSGPTDGTQEFTNNKRLLLAAIDKTHGRKLTSSTVSRTNEYYRARDMRQTGDPLNDPEDSERAFNARDTLITCGTWPTGSRQCAAGVRRFSSSAKGSITTSPICLQPQQRVADPRRDAADDRGGDPVECSIYGIDPRGLTNLGDESIEVGAFPDDTTLGVGHGVTSERAQAVAGQSAHALRGNRWLRRGESERFLHRVRPDRA